MYFFVSSRRRHTRCALVTGVQTCALPIFVRNAAAAQRVDRVGEDVEPLFHDQPAKEADDRRVVVDAELAPPNRIAPAGMEYLALDPAGPDADVVVHPLLAQHLRKAFGR